MASLVQSVLDCLGSTWTFASILLENSGGTPDYKVEYPDLTGKVFIVTGGLTGIGLEVTKQLAAKGAKVYSFSRNAARAEKAIAEIKSEQLGAQVVFVPLDFDKLETIEAAAKVFLSKEQELHGVIHNAGVYADGDSLSDEAVFRINVLGPHLFQKYLDAILINTAGKYPQLKGQFRIVWVSSVLHATSFISGGINWDHLQKKTPLIKFGLFNNGATYGHSKAATIYESIQWNIQHPDSNVVSISLHPGLILTDIHNYSGMFVAKALGRPPAAGALVELYASLSPEITSANAGAHIIPWGKFGRIRPDIELAARGPEGARFWKYLDAQVAPYYN